MPVPRPGGRPGRCPAAPRDPPTLGQHTASMPLFTLRCAYKFTHQRGGTVLDRQSIEADTIGEAAQLALIRSVERRNLRLVSAVLLGPDNRIAWSLKSSDATSYYDAQDEAGDGLPPHGTE